MLKKLIARFKNRAIADAATLARIAEAQKRRDHCGLDKLSDSEVLRLITKK